MICAIVARARAHTHTVAGGARNPSASATSVAAHGTRQTRDRRDRTRVTPSIRAPGRFRSFFHPFFRRCRRHSRRRRAPLIPAKRIIGGGGKKYAELIIHVRASAYLCKRVSTVKYKKKNGRGRVHSRVKISIYDVSFAQTSPVTLHYICARAQWRCNTFGPYTRPAGTAGWFLFFERL